MEFLGNNEILWGLDRETLALNAGELTEQSNIAQCEVPENLKRLGRENGATSALKS